MVCVLLSCMYQTNTKIIERANIQTDVVVINQCDENSITNFTFYNKKNRKCKATFINTKDRGLSRSRNMAIANVSTNTICLLCDDDEILENDYESKILEGYKKYPDADVIAYSINWNKFQKKCSTETYRLDFRKILKVCSTQITFKSQSIIDNKISFDEKLGSGTGNGGGEENKFMLDCRRAKLNMYYYPNVIASIMLGESTWFKGFSDDYFINYGWSARRIYGNFFLSLFVILYYAISKYKLYKDSSSLSNALFKMMVGFFQSRN